MVDSTPPILGRWRIIKKYRNREEWGPWTKNTICVGYGKAVGSLLTSGISGGTTTTNTAYIALGAGSSSWDAPSVAPAVPTTSTLLTNELTGGRKLATIVGYRQDNGTIASAGSAVTFNQPIFAATWNSSELVSGAPTKMREAALFTNASSTINNGTMLNTLRFPFIAKDLLDPYTMTWQLEFQINV